VTKKSIDFDTIPNKKNKKKKEIWLIVAISWRKFYCSQISYRRGTASLFDISFFLETRALNIFNSVDNKKNIQYIKI